MPSKPLYDSPSENLSYFAHSFTPNSFLSPSRQLINPQNDDEVLSFTKEIFEHTTSEKMPDNFKISVLSLESFKLVHSVFGRWSSGILGFSLNELKQVFVRETDLATLLIVIGHEIGHILTPSLENKHDEEAKAFAFTMEWANNLKEHNVANLGTSISQTFSPAKNGLHDLAFEFVDLMTRKSRNAKQLHEDLVKRYVSILNKTYF